LGQPLAVATSLKARIMLSLGYGCGLRAGEVVRLKVKHIDAAQRIIRVDHDYQLELGRSHNRQICRRSECGRGALMRSGSETLGRLGAGAADPTGAAHRRSLQ
jgi:hypothetical protein